MLLAIGLTIIAHLAIPTAFLVWLWRGNDRSKVDWLLKLLAVTLYSVHIFAIGRWDWFSYYLQFVLALLLIAATYQSFIKAEALPLLPPREFGSYFSLGTSSFVVLFFLAVLSSYIPQGYFFNGESVRLSFPLQNGTYYIAHGGNSPAINYHNVNPTQRYALDVVKLNTVGTRANGVYPRSLTNYVIFAETLYSPCNGKISEIANDLPDLIPPQRDRQNPAGNYILMRCQGAEVLMAHLQRGSIAVRAGEDVKVGQAIAKIGNSGNTSEPHLHIHATKANTGKSLLDGVGMPITFDGKFLVRNNLLFN